MDSPIYTRIKNNTPIEKLVMSGDVCAVIPAGGTADTPYELWSMAEDGQRIAIETEIADGSLEFTVCVKGADGSYVEAPFWPVARSSASAAPQPMPAVQPKVNLMKDLAEADDHVIKAKSDTTEENKAWYNVTAAEEKPVEELGVEGAGTEGFKSSSMKPSVSAEPETAEQDIEAEFDELCAAKKWNDALALLKGRFGDKVTFSTRAIMALKTYRAVCDKYLLA